MQLYKILLTRTSLGRSGFNENNYEMMYGIVKAENLEEARTKTNEYYKRVFEHVGWKLVDVFHITASSKLEEGEIVWL